MKNRITIFLYVVLFTTVCIVEGQTKRMFVNVFINCIVISITVVFSY